MIFDTVIADRFLGPSKSGIEHFGQSVKVDIRYGIGHYARNDDIRDHKDGLSISRSEHDV